ncbi:MAG: hypothetical protein ABL890_02040 [Candidatus Peribacteraceae bacterium]
MQRTLALLGMMTLLAACGGSGSTSTTAKCTQQFWNKVFAACLPDGWKVLSEDTLRTLGVPEETMTAFQATEPHAGQLDTVTVTTEPLSTDLGTTEYSQANILAVSSLPEYQLIDKETVFIDGDESSIHVFSARPTPGQPIRRYYQLSASKEKTGYSFTGSFPLSIEEDEAKAVALILKSVSFNDPAAAKE